MRTIFQFIRSGLHLPDCFRRGRSTARRVTQVARSTQFADHWHFLSRFAHRPWTIGAVAPSSARLARTVINHCDLGRADTVVELGAGSGAITGLILRRLKPGAVFIALEIDPKQAQFLRKRYPGLTVCCESAENIDACLARHGRTTADCIISGLPWGNMRHDLQDRIMSEVLSCLAPGGKFCGFAYLHASWFPSSRAFRQRLAEHFSRVRISPVIWRNLPPAFAYSCG
jgi:phosphatidylethanolamine/phosphatidyl-N-methylethanolamine N-methyltransferase